MKQLRDADNSLAETLTVEGRGKAPAGKKWYEKQVACALDQQPSQVKAAARFGNCGFAVGELAGIDFNINDADTFHDEPPEDSTPEHVSGKLGPGLGSFPACSRPCFS
jgi:hypothetical protein